MADNTEYTRPGFLASYFDAMRDRAHEDGWRAVLPLWAVIGCALGSILTYYLPSELWSDRQQWQTIIAIYAAMVTINGLLLALSWSAFARIHELLVASAEFSQFLRQINLFKKYLFYIDWVQAAQLLAMIVSGIGLFTSVVSKIPLLGHRIILAISIAVTVYAIRYAVNAVTVMHDLVWQKAIFDEQDLDERQKVVKLGGQRGRREDAGSQFDLNCSVHGPVGRNDVEIDELGQVAVSVGWWRVGHV